MRLDKNCQFPRGFFYEKHKKVKSVLTFFVLADSICSSTVDNPAKNIHQTAFFTWFFPFFL